MSIVLYKTEALWEIWMRPKLRTWKKNCLIISVVFTFISQFHAYKFRKRIVSTFYDIAFLLCFFLQLFVALRACGIYFVFVDGCDRDNDLKLSSLLLSEEDWFNLWPPWKQSWKISLHSHVMLHFLIFALVARLYLRHTISRCSHT